MKAEVLEGFEVCLEASACGAIGASDGEDGVHFLKILSTESEILNGNEWR